MIKSLSVLLFICIADVSCTSQSELISDCACEEWFGWEEEEGITCHYLTVPEDHRRPAGKQIQIAFAVFSAQEDVGGFPTLYLTGGPGGRSLNSMQRWASHHLRNVGDLIIVEQRGVGLSSPLPEVSDRTYDLLAADLSASEERDATAALLQTLRDEIIARDIDISCYNSTQNAHDFGRLMKELDYKKYHLYGSSYGTRLAAGIMRDYPEFVHAAILNGPANLDGKALEGRFPNLALALDKLYVACSEDPRCQGTYPDLKATLIAALDDLVKNPLTVDAGFGPYVINPQDAIYLLRYLLYRSTGYETAPPFIHALNDRDVETVSRLARGPMQFARAPGITAFYAYQAYEELRPESPEVVDSMMSTIPELQHGLGWFQAFIPHLGNFSSKRASRAEQTFEGIVVPGLVIVNEFDPVTPPHHTSMFENALEHCQVIRLNQFGHGSDNSCLRQITHDFLSHPKKPIDRSCLN